MNVDCAPLGVREGYRVLRHRKSCKHIRARQPVRLGMIVIEGEAEGLIPFPGLVREPRAKERALESDAVAVPQCGPGRWGRNFLAAEQNERSPADLGVC